MAASHDLWSTQLDDEHRPLLQYFIYDYLIRKNMHQTAEILKNEANVSYTKTPVEVTNPPEGMLCKWWKTSHEELDFFKEIMHNSHTRGKILSAKGKQMGEGMQDWNASQSGTYPMNVQANKQLLNKFSSTMSKGTKATHSMGLHGSDHVSQGFSPYSDKLELLTSELGKCTPISYAMIVHQLEPLFCALEKKAVHEEPDPEIQHLIDSFWEVENCPSPLLGKITPGEVNGTKKTSASSRKLRGISKAADLPTVHLSKFKRKR